MRVDYSSVVAVVAVELPSIAIFLCVSAGYESIPSDNRVIGGIFSSLRASLTGIVVATILRSWKKCVGGAVGRARAVSGVQSRIGYPCGGRVFNLL